MAYELVEEVLDHAPEDLGPAERLLLVCIAERCRGNARMRDIGTAELRRRTGLDERGLRHAAQRLEKAGLKVRVALRLDKHGKPVYAVPGRVCRWVLPPLTPPDGCVCLRCLKEDGGVLLNLKEDGEVRQADPQVRQADREVRQADRGVPLLHPYRESLPADPTLVLDRRAAYALASEAVARSSLLSRHPT